MNLPGGYFDAEGEALTVSNQVEFTAESAARAAQRVDGGFLWSFF